MLSCPSSNLLSLEDACVRTAWSALVPLAFVSFCILRHLSIHAFSKYFPFLSPLEDFLSLEEAEALDHDESKPKDIRNDHKKRQHRWFTVALAILGLIETCSWLAIAAYMFAAGDKDKRWRTLAFTFSSTWLYGSLIALLRPLSSPPYDLFVLYLLHLVGACLMLGGSIFDHYVSGVPMPTRLVFAGMVANLTLILVALSLVFSRPLNDPTVMKEISVKNVNPEDFTTLWGWFTFSWINPLIRKGTSETLKEEDVWELSVSMKAKPIFRKFAALDQKCSLLWKIWAANSKDIICEFIGRLATVIFLFLDPFFLKCVIDAVDDGSPSIARAYIFAIFMFSSQILRSQASLLHLWYGRRASVRIRSQLRSAIYDKALKRKDLSGTINKQEKGKDGKEKESQPQAGADIGKIVNLMSGDASRIGMLVATMHLIYSAPFEIIIAAVFLYQLLGFSAFAGFAALLLSWPLNGFMTRRAIHIQKGILAARDRRMGIVNELLGALKFIKFFASEERWIARTQNSRAEELRWLVKSRFNSILFNAVWDTAPILVSVLSFFTYVSQGNELTVSKAFTAISLFSMIRRPLNVIPSKIVNILQGLVALRRIEAFLNEDEVGPQVSTLKEDTKKFSDMMVLGLENASLKWNSAEENEVTEGQKSKNTESGMRATDNTHADMVANITDGPQSSQAGIMSIQPDHVFELRDISVIFPNGALSVVIGPTASGKTALLLALLGEMTLVDGRILIQKDPHRAYENGLTHSISYAAQTPWLQQASIKENILFGAPYEPERYAAVLDACALGRDLTILEDGDETEIGTRGISLSGGQKARVALARAVYARTKFVLLDDPLSAVDSHTARHLFEKLLMGPLLKARTVILVTHHIELVLSGASYLVHMLNGRIDVQGTTEELRDNGTLGAILAEVGIRQHKEYEQISDEEEQEEDCDSAQETRGAGNVSNTLTRRKSKKPRKFVKDEERETGGVKWKIYKTYLKASSYWTLLIILFLITCWQFLGFAEKYWIKLWGEAYRKSGSIPSIRLFSLNFILGQHDIQPNFPLAYSLPNTYQDLTLMGTIKRLPPARRKPLFYVSVYALIGLLTVVVRLTGTAMQYTGALYASRTLFTQLLQTVVHASMRWIDTVPTGRILNRFSKDIGTIDSSLAGSLQDMNRSIANFLAALIVIVAVLPPFVIPAILIGFFYYKVAIGYLSTGRDLHRMESNARSPVFSGFSELLEGIVTVRAFSAEPRFQNDLYRKIDHFMTMFYHFHMANRWMLLRFDFLGACVVFCTTIFVLSSAQASREGWAGWAGICITSAIQFMNTVYFACRSWTQFELDLNSVERIVEYLDLPQEPPAIIENSRPPAHWPSCFGPNEDKLIEVKELVVRYAPDLPPVLHQVSFALRARERVGLLGRTGSGKSTLVMSLLRFTDPAEGQIKIDGIDITTIGVNDLRSRITFIPQDATLFSGTIRDNLDPFGDHSDLECFDALRRVQLVQDGALVTQCSSRAPSVRNVEREELNASAGSMASSASSTVVGENESARGGAEISLNTEVSAGGLNFSAGQRQLIAMARALLRRSAVVILDEATSSIDFATDEKIQQAIREEFSNSLLLTIAHRLHTVIDYDRLLVLDAGRIVEFDTPYNLIEKEGGIFREMCMKSGNFTELHQAAKAKAESSH